MDELESAIEDSVGKDNKLVFTGHRGCGKSTLLAELGFRLKDTGRYFLHVLEYRNGLLWYDLHPIVMDLLLAEGVI